MLICQDQVSLILEVQSMEPLVANFQKDKDHKLVAEMKETPGQETTELKWMQLEQRCHRIL